jgi:hypothetical protein
VRPLCETSAGDALTGLADPMEADVIVGRWPGAGSAGAGPVGDRPPRGPAVTGGRGREFGPVRQSGARVDRGRLGGWEHPSFVRPEAEQRGHAGADDQGDIGGDDPLQAHHVRADPDERRGDHQADAVEDEEQHVLAAQAGAVPMPERPVAVREVGERRGDHGGDHVRGDGAHPGAAVQQIEDRESDDEGDRADTSELRELTPEMREPTAQTSDEAHEENLPFDVLWRLMPSGRGAPPRAREPRAARWFRMRQRLAAVLTALPVIIVALLVERVMAIAQFPGRSWDDDARMPLRRGGHTQFDARVWQAVHPPGIQVLPDGLPA